jgi:hypothetical protein
VIAFSNAVKIDDYDQKAIFFKEFTNKIVPGSWEYLHSMMAKELIG